MAFLLVCLLAVAEVSVVLGGQQRYDFPCDLTPAEHNHMLQKVVTTLQEDNWTVKEGVLEFGNTFEQFFGNPSSPYGTYNFDDEPFWNLGQTDAVVFFGCTPPQVKYFSFRSYVFETFQNGHSTTLFASLGDSMNQMVIRSPGRNPFGRTTVVTTTADILTDRRVRKAFIAAGVPQSTLNTDIVPSSLVNMGLEPLKDTFGMVYRVAVPKNPEEVNAYVNFTWPILYVQPPIHQSPLPFPIPALREQGTGETEDSYSASLLELVNEVIESVQSTGNHFYTRERIVTYDIEGYTCIEENTECFGDNRDANYATTTSENTLEGSNDPSFFIVCGLNHVKTGKATYINLAVNSVVAVDDSAFGESASQYAPDMPDVDMFYAYKVARQCNGESYCLEVSMEDVEENAPFQFLSRAYLEPPTKVGPDGGAELLMPYVLYFKPQ